MNDIEDLSATAPSSSARLSLAIAELVARTLGGEPIDTATEGAQLAERHADLGMSGEMIASAIGRAVGMVGAIRNGGDAPEMQDAGMAVAAEVDAEPEPPLDTGPVVGPDLVDIIGQGHDPIVLQSTPELALLEAEATAAPSRPLRIADPPSPVMARFARGPVAAVRRALFRQ